jgi:protein MpaA
VSESRPASPPLMALNRIRSYATLVERVTASLKGEVTAAVTYHEVQLDHISYPLVKVVLGKGVRNRAVLAGGLHGDEPAGPEALCELLEQRLYLKFVQDWALTLLPCLNPWGYEHGRRHNHQHKDLNREFKSPHPQEEVAFAQSVLRQRFDLVVDLHEDVDSVGYYLYEQAEAEQERGIGHVILDQVQSVIPINRDRDIEGQAANGGVINRVCNVDQMDAWPLAVYAMAHGTSRSPTLEAPVVCPLEKHVAAHLLAIQGALDTAAREV